MVSEGKGRLFKRKDGKYLVYIPKDLAEDSMFPFKDDLKPSERGERGESLSMLVKVSFQQGVKKLIIEPL